MRLDNFMKSMDGLIALWELVCGNCLGPTQGNHVCVL